MVYLGDDKPILVKTNQANKRNRGNSESKSNFKNEIDKSKPKRIF